MQKFGGVDVFKAIKTKKQSIDDGLVRIEIAACGINRLDLRIRQGKLPYLVDDFPLVMHGNISGVVTEIGDGVFNLRKGDEVYGFIGGVSKLPGGMQEEVVVPQGYVAKKPKTLSLEDSASLPYSVLLAYLMVFEHTKIRPGQTVMVYDGLSGVGHIATQLAKHMKTRVVTCIKYEKERDEAKTYLADYIINTKKEKVVDYVKKYTGGEGFSVIIDPLGDAHLTTSLEAAATFGTIATNNTNIKCDLSLMNEKSLNLHVVNMVQPMLMDIVENKYQDILSDIALMIDRGDIVPRIDKSIFYFEDVAKAHAYAETEKTMGNVVLRIK